MREDHSVLELLKANYTFVNERLARHYGIPNYGSRFRRVTLTDEAGGFAGKGHPDPDLAAERTSPVVRGKWVLENILGSPPPTPAERSTLAEGQALGAECASGWSSTAPIPSAPVAMRRWTRSASRWKTLMRLGSGEPARPGEDSD
jgi:hypothetical protein